MNNSASFHFMQAFIFKERKNMYTVHFICIIFYYKLSKLPYNSPFGGTFFTQKQPCKKSTPDILCAMSLYVQTLHKQETIVSSLLFITGKETVANPMYVGLLPFYEESLMDCSCTSLSSSVNPFIIAS